MRFLVDAQLPPALARAITERGHVAEHVVDIGPGDATDHALWDYATNHDAVLVTKDADFVDMSLAGGFGPSLVWIRVGNTRRQELHAWFVPLIDDITRLVEDGQKVIELR